MTGYIFLLLAGVAAGTLSGVVGTGGSIVLMPILVYQFGPQQAVPIMAIAAVLGNIGKAVAWWREVDWRAFWAYAVLGVPGAALGARTLLVLPPAVVETMLGGFFLLMIPGRRWMQARDIRIRYWQMAVIGGLIGYLSGIVLSTGPLSIPAFLAIGLTKGALISTEAAKVVTFQQEGALPGPMILQGLIVGGSMMVGAYFGKQVMARISLKVFENVMDVMLFCSGMALLWTAVK